MIKESFLIIILFISLGKILTKAASNILCLSIVFFDHCSTFFGDHHSGSVCVGSDYIWHSENLAFIYEAKCEEKKRHSIKELAKNAYMAASISRKPLTCLTFSRESTTEPIAPVPTICDPDTVTYFI